MKELNTRKDLSCQQTKQTWTMIVYVYLLDLIELTNGNEHINKHNFFFVFVHLKKLHGSCLLVFVH